MHSDEKPRFLKLFPLSGNPIASYGESVRFKPDFQSVFEGLDHGIGHPSRLRFRRSVLIDQAESGFEGSGRHPT
jgi:hypothetical protein